MLAIEFHHAYHSRLLLGGWTIGHILRWDHETWAWFLQMPIAGGVLHGTEPYEAAAGAAVLQAAASLIQRTPKKTLADVIRTEIANQASIYSIASETGNAVFRA